MTADSVTRYQQLDPAEIVATIERLETRIRERFPDRGLVKIAHALLEAARASAETTARLARANVPLRVAIFALLAAFVVLVGWGVTSYELSPTRIFLHEFVQTAEAGIATLVFIGAAVLFLVSLEARIKRQRTQRALHDLRAIAQIVDMHQLTKDPDRLDRESGEDTESSPKLGMTAFELGRYFDYCMELESLIGKVAELYAQATVDSTVIAAVDDLEHLTTGLARKTWQKMMLLSDAVPG